MIRRALAIDCAVVAVADAVSTWLFLSQGTGVEGNPLVAGTMSVLGVLPALAAWTLLRWAAVALMVRISDHAWTTTITALLTVLLVGTTWVVFHNLQPVS